jgi:hypothetical protein
VPRSPGSERTSGGRVPRSRRFERDKEPCSDTRPGTSDVPTGASLESLGVSVTALEACATGVGSSDVPTDRQAIPGDAWWTRVGSARRPIEARLTPTGAWLAYEGTRLVPSSAPLDPVRVALLPDGTSLLTLGTWLTRSGPSEGRTSRGHGPEGREPRSCWRFARSSGSEGDSGTWVARSCPCDARSFASRARSGGNVARACRFFARSCRCRGRSDACRRRSGRRLARSCSCRARSFVCCATIARGQARATRWVAHDAGSRAHAFGSALRPDRSVGASAPGDARTHRRQGGSFANTSIRGDVSLDRPDRALAPRRPLRSPCEDSPSKRERPRNDGGA